MMNATYQTATEEVARLTEQLVEKAEVTIARAQELAWAIVNLKAQMRTEPVRFCYVKNDGTIRLAAGCYAAAPRTATDTTRPLNPLVIPYFDTAVKGWRSFRADRLIIG